MQQIRADKDFLFENEVNCIGKQNTKETGIEERRTRTRRKKRRTKRRSLLTLLQGRKGEI